MMMNTNNRRTSWPVALLCGAIALNSCSSAPSADRAQLAASAPVVNNADSENKADNAPALGKVTGTNQAPRPQQPQLIKTASLSLRLESIDQAVEQIRQIVRDRQGDIYKFQDDRPQDNNRRRASLTLKVPSNRLDDSVSAIGKLGQVQSQTIESADVTQQLVDSDARLKNLRQQEEIARKIMERSGSIKDVLAVSRELANIRQQIEQLTATVKNLRQQVAYSTINLQIEEIKATNPASDPLGIQVRETWKNSTQAAAGLATNLFLTFLWLLPFTPYLAIGASAVYFFRRRRQPQPLETTPSNSEE
jgi:archaellum component FlaC